MENQKVYCNNFNHIHVLLANMRHFLKQDKGQLLAVKVNALKIQ